MLSPIWGTTYKESINSKNDKDNHIHKNKHNKEYITLNNSPQIDFNIHMDKTDSNNLFKVYHQNIRGLKDKLKELTNCSNTETSYIVCLLEHHLKEYETGKTNIKQYVLWVKFCRQSLKNGGVCIFIHEIIKYSTISLQEHCKEQDTGICSVMVISSIRNFIIINVHISPHSNFKQFLRKLDNIINLLHKNKIEYILCGDININYLENCTKKRATWWFINHL